MEDAEMARSSWVTLREGGERSERWWGLCPHGEGRPGRRGLQKLLRARSPRVPRHTAPLNP